MAAAEKTSSRRADILSATRSLLALHGHHAVTTREIAQRVGVSVPLIYKHFRSKEELLAEACDPDLQEVIRALDSVSEDFSGDATARIGAALRVLLTFAAVHADSFEALYSLRGRSCEGPILNCDQRALPFQELAEAVRTLRPAVPEAMVLTFCRSVWLLAHGVAELSIKTKAAALTSLDVDGVVQVLLHGIVTNRGRQH